MISAKLILLDKVLQAIKQDDLLENTRQAGDVLLNGLKELQNKFPQYLNSARGLGTFCAINCDSGARYKFYLQKKIHCSFDNPPIEMSD